MSFRSVAVVLTLLLVCTVSASYAGDKPLVTTFYTDLPAAYSFSTGNSTYGGSLSPGDGYAVQLPYTLPDGAEVLYQRIYLYWSWSRIGQDAIYPSFQVLADGMPLPLIDRYTDSKGFVSANDFFSGMDTYQAPHPLHGDGEITISVLNGADDTRTVVLMGAALLIVYSSELPGQIWVSEGCDMLYASHGITQAMASSAILFEGDVRTRDLTTADLLLVAPSGGHTRTEIPQKNAIFINRERGGNLPGFIESIIAAIFPGYNGKVWYDAFVSDEINQIGVDYRDVRQYLRETGNTVLVQDNGDYLTLTNAVLDIRYGG
ncbi:MAG: DUF3344 domain-containing protein [Methanocalculus sp.]|uniref:DUF3344 domain-containing protein n=1 Tax=Methanocalculus sp. TaxID=2004547 RepID=UPI00271E01E9|nr:DUF3344 domain-containing protein [Methanocalculus sp.]MDO9538966.1 DUF3344 domain-containing protein [Methanocalculus sp.]